MTDPIQYRSIAPGPSPTSEGSPPERERDRRGTNPWKKRVSTACLACKKSKRKCSGTAPCDNCRAFNRVCIFDESLDQRRRVAAKRTADELNYHRDMLNDLFKVIRTADEGQAMRLLDAIRTNGSAEEIRAYIDETLHTLEGSDQGESREKLEGIRRTIGVEGTDPSFRRKVMDIHYLCDEAPCKVPAKPWTRVTEDDDLVSHLISLYFTWDYPFHAFLDRDIFLKYMARGDKRGDGEFCNEFLVNAVLANACHFSEFSEAYVVPGDIVTKGADFLAEAERLRKEGQARVSLASIQGSLLLYERYSISGNDDLGYHMLHEAIRAGEYLGLIGGKGIQLVANSEDMDISMKRTAWGLFNVDTIVHTGFLRPTLIPKVNTPRLNRHLSSEQSLWIPYPSHRSSRPSYISQYFDETCNVCEIARDISHGLFGEDQRGASEAYRRRIKDEMYERLRRWYGGLPDYFDPGRKPPPYIILLRMRYHTLVINLFAWHPLDDGTGATFSEAPKTPESPPGKSPLTKDNTWEITQSAAREIAALVRLHRREYGMSRAHHFAIYAINLALFTMLEPDTFDILDPDFLSLASAFSIIASRSTLGRNMFHIFRQSVRSKSQGKRIQESTAVSDELKELFDEDSVAKGLNRWDEYAEGLQKLNQDERYHGIGEGGGHGLQEYPGMGLLDMLDRYESLSLGKDDGQERRRSSES